MTRPTIICKVLAFLLNGERHTTLEIETKCKCSHASAVIRDLRFIYNVQDKWKVNEHGASVKEFWIDPNNKYKLSVSSDLDAVRAIVEMARTQQQIINFDEPCQGN